MVEGADQLEMAFAAVGAMLVVAPGVKQPFRYWPVPEPFHWSFRAAGAGCFRYRQIDRAAATSLILNQHDSWSTVVSAFLEQLAALVFLLLVLNSLEPLLGLESRCWSNWNSFCCLWHWFDKSLTAIAWSSTVTCLLSSQHW